MAPNKLLQAGTTPRTAPQFFLRTLGAVDLIAARSNTPVDAVLGKPKRLALLAYLAGHADAPPQREKLLGVFWPESPAHQARHALSQALYLLRKELGPESIRLLSGNRVSIDPSIVEFDAASLTAAVGAGDVDRALRLYKGDFLDGFGVPGCWEFDDWMSRERDRLRRLASQAAADAADSALVGDDAAEAIRCVREWLRITPYDEAAIRQLVLVYRRLGDRASAIAAYRQFESRLAAELDLEPSPITKAVVEDLLHDQASRHVVRPPTQAPRPDRSETTEAIGSRHRAKQPAMQSDRWRLSWPVMATVLLMLVVAAFVIALRSPPRHGMDEPTALAVLPFTVHGPPDVQFLREGLADLFVATLSAVPGVRTLNPHQYDDAPPDGTDLTLPQQAAVARRLQADQYIYGSVVIAGDRIQIRAALHYVDSLDDPVATAVASGPEHELLDMVDRLAANLLSSEESPAAQRLARVASVTSHSYAAVRAYLHGEQEFRRTDWTESLGERFEPARHAYLQAVREDSTFALAYHRLAVISMWIGDRESTEQWTELALRYASRLPLIYRSIVRAHAAFQDLRVAEAERLFRLVLRERPDEREALTGLGDLLIHYNPLRGRSPHEARPYLDLALVGDPRHPLVSHLITLAAREGDFERVDSITALRVDQGHWRVLGDLHRGKQHIADQLVQDPDLFTFSAGMNVAHFLGQLATAQRLLYAAEHGPPPNALRHEARYMRALVEVARGRVDAAFRVLQAGEFQNDASAVGYKAWFLTLPFVPLNQPLRDSIQDLLSGGLWAPGTYYGIGFPRQATASNATRQYLAGLLHLRMGHLDSALSFAAALERSTESPMVDSLAWDLARTIRARALWEHHNDPAAALRVLGEPSLLTPVTQMGSPFYGRNDLRFLRAELLRHLGHHEDALDWYAGFGMGEPAVDVVHLPAVHLGMAAIYEARGDLANAREHLEMVLRMWRSAEGIFEKHAVAVHARLDNLNAQ